MSSRSKNISTFLLGAAVGLVVGYFLNSEKVDEVISDLKEKANQWKDELEEQLGKGKELVDDLSAKVTEVIGKDLK